MHKNINIFGAKIILLVFAFIFLWTIHGSFLSGTFVGLHDAKLHALNFIAFFRHAQQGESIIAQWLPYGGYGIPALVNQCYFGVFDYLSLGIGLLFRIQNPVWVWNISVFFQLFVFTTGSYLLAKELTSNSLIIITMTALAICLPVWQYAYEFGFTIYFFMPLVLYFAHRFHIEKNITWGGVSFLIALAGTVGSPIYIIPIISALTLLTLTLSALASKKKLFLDFSKRPSFILFFALIASLFVAFHIVASFRGGQDLIFLFPGRDMISKRVPIDVFLTYGGNIHDQNPWSLVSGSAGDLKWHGYTIGSYILLSLSIASLYFFTNSRWVVVLFTCVAGVFAFSRGGLVSVFLYDFFPGVPYFRHLGLIQGIATPFLFCIGTLGLSFLFKRKKIDGRTSIFYISVSLLLTFFIFDIISPQTGLQFRGILDSSATNVPKNVFNLFFIATLIFVSIFAASSRLPEWMLNVFISIIFLLTIFSGLNLREKAHEDFKNGFINAEVKKAFLEPPENSLKRSELLHPLLIGLAPFANGTETGGESFYNTQAMNALGIDSHFPYGMYHFIANQTKSYLDSEWLTPRVGWQDQFMIPITKEAKNILGYDRNIISFTSEDDNLLAKQIGLDLFKTTFEASGYKRTLFVSQAYVSGWKAESGNMKLDIRPSEKFGFFVTIPASIEHANIFFRDPINYLVSHALWILGTLNALFALFWISVKFFSKSECGRAGLSKISLPQVQNGGFHPSSSQNCV